MTQSPVLKNKRLLSNFMKGLKTESRCAMQITDSRGDVPLVLLVDDNPIQAAVRKEVLTRAGAEIIVASNGVEALQILERSGSSRSVRLMVTDHLMPEMDGPELVRRVRERLPALPVVVLSGLPDAEAEYGGGVVFRLKPFAPQELIRLIKHLLGDWSLRSA